MVSSGVVKGAVALKDVPSAKLTALAVLPTNEPPIESEALGPKLIPLGLSRNRLAVPLARSNPSMLEIVPPFTRLMMF